MANTAVNPSTADLNGNFMEVYADSLKDLLPLSTQLLKRVPFEQRTKIGNKFHQPVVVKTEQGFTYAAPNMGAFNLNTFASLQTVDATVDASNLVLASALDYETAARASVSKAAFAEATGLKVKHMTAATRKRQEISAWYGQVGLGTINAKSNVDSTNERLTITTANFAPLIWAGMAGSRVYIDNGSGTQVSSGADGVFTITKVDIASKYVYVSGTSTGITALDGITPSDSHRIWFESSVNFGAFAHADMQGLHSQLATSGSVLGVDNSVYDQWKPNSYAVGGALNYKGVNDAVSLAVSRGLDEDCEVFVSYKTFGNLVADLAALRIIDSSYDSKKAIAGHESIEFHGLNGKVTVTPSGYVKEGFAYVLPIKDIIRVGATDLTFNTPGSKNPDIFFQLSSQAGFGMRCYAHQGIALLAPSKAVLLTGIVNT